MLEHKYISSYTNDTDTCSKSVLQSLRQQLPQVANEICLKINMSAIFGWQAETIN